MSLKVFLKYDANGNGVIEFDEFQELMFDLLGVTDRKDYPLDRLKVFWPPISNALTREKAKEISKSVFPFSRTF